MAKVNKKEVVAVQKIIEAVQAEIGLPADKRWKHPNDFLRVLFPGLAAFAVRVTDREYVAQNLRALADNIEKADDNDAKEVLDAIKSVH